LSSFAIIIIEIHNMALFCSRWCVMCVGVLLIFQIPGLPYVNPLLGNLRYILTGEAMEASIKYEVLIEQPFNHHLLRLD